ncbi:MAG TPA: cation:proton antiporter [Vicinamibacterales bacterium]|nr:cation:proton antiporter [Vicinamibacterales bacterium]
MLVKVLLALTVIVITARLTGALFARLNQPAVIGEVVGGILLGPSLLGRVAPGLAASLIPADAAPFLNVLAQLGVILYMFLVGLELDLRVLRARVSTTLAISQTSIAVPFLLGSALAYALYGSLAPSGVPFSSFLLFLGVSMSITAFPVLARILEDRGLQRTPMGTLALTCAAINDAMAWCLLALVVGVMQDTPLAAARTVGLTFVFIAVMLTGGRLIIGRAVARLDASPRIGEQSLALVLVAVLLSAVATEFIGIHAIFGAFLLGAIVPHESRIGHLVREKIEDVVRVLFLPAFFAFTGLRTEIGLLQTLDDWLMCLVIITIATAGKFGGATLAARVTGLDWRDSAALGILMNTRGLVELIVLNIGLDLGVLSPRLFTMLVMMAVVTTMMTSPILMSLLRKRPWVNLTRQSA